ncbi:hypothetical protein LTR99_003056 [Exophiala xenobiotica]|uniref:Uncharacterized protein n=1 Tax=Vermiconidia calcicola TaxID=1690605 RepID=A0AAV9QEB4_9PEZI|nr:hypothetical protein LTR92_005798 [Exophiala xenobiotica]KAK5538723.1 hypothetical protein LTR25_004266 [Vermiconidia calcicola]KAK5547788.1 hypothetical protein LTR23_002036 [Chaetothyriales sp. CCFEE 6169]KAK5212738.1 hypothetical protein LTR41_001685 [Exophiala xenobiotica]KAK5268123.1 hypothetical protein LTR96_006669 [Exophiala xenobiotica]
MSDPNAFISNGTCYTARGERLDGSFIPCGNDAFGHQACCGAGDNCLGDNACFGVHGSGYGSYLTYWAGCTDPNYEDATCPKKEVDQPWVALTRCDDEEDEWAICSQVGNPSTLQPGASCSCTIAASATIAFTDSSTLSSICSLPKSTGQSIQFFVGHFPSSTLASASGPAAPSQNSASTSPSAGGSSSGAASSAGAPNSSAAASNSATATSGPNSAQGTSTSGPTSAGATSTDASSGSVTVFTSSGTTFTSTVTPSTTSSAAVAGGSSGGGSHSGLSSAAKIGIGVGAGIGALILLALISIFFLLRRKRQRRPPSKIESEGRDYSPPDLSKPPPADEPPKSEVAPAPVPTPYDTDGQMMPEADGRAAWPWTLRSELEGSNPARNGQPYPIAELPGSGNFPGENGAGDSTLVGEANRQIGPGWQKGSSLKLLNTSAGKEYLQSSS